jgi:acetyl esterase/lipase
MLYRLSLLFCVALLTIPSTPARAASAPTTAPATAPVTQPAALATVDVWPAGKMPGRPATQPEADRPPKADGFRRITNVSRPTLSVFPAPKSDRPAPAMIVCPGGGYSYVVIDKEGTEIAAWLNANGITAIVLKYRVPHNREGALQDVQRALSLARAHAGEWNVDPKRLGVIGFSAGGNLSAKASTLFDQRAYRPIDEIDQQPCRPDFAVLVYPAYLDDKNGHVAPDLNLKADIPPTLIVHSEDDRTFVPGSKLYHAALEEAKKPNEFMLYPTGGHGYALHCDRDARAWPDACLAWLHKIGVR